MVSFVCVCFFSRKKKQRRGVEREKGKEGRKKGRKEGKERVRGRSEL